MPANTLLGEADPAPLFKCRDTAQELQDLISPCGVQRGRGGSSRNGRVLPCLYWKWHRRVVGKVGSAGGVQGKGSGLAAGGSLAGTSGLEFKQGSTGCEG